MNLWADVYSAAGSRLGDGPIRLRSASVSRRLDGAGSVSITVPGTDLRAVTLLLSERRIRVYSFAGGVEREIGRGILRRIRTSGSPSDWTMIADGPDDLDELARISTKLGRKYAADSVSDIATSLVGLVSGWSVSASGGNTLDARFDGLSVLKALLTLVEGQGLHVRAGSSAKTVEIGAFGTDSGLRLLNPTQGMAALYDNDEIALVASISVEKNSEAVATRLYPMGSGIGEAFLSLEQSTRISPYTIGTVAGPSGDTQYYLEDATGVSAYGTIEKYGKFRQVAPLSNSAADLETASNALYDVAAAWLARYSVRQDVYRVSCKKVRTTIRPGDKVRLVYNGVISRDGVVVNYLNVDTDMWVMEVSERYGVEGQTVEMVLSTIDRHELDGAQLVIGALEEITLDGVTVKPYFNSHAWVYDRLIDSSTPASVPVRITNATLRLNRCLLRMKTRSFTSTVIPETVNTLHEHGFVATSALSPSTMYWRYVAWKKSDGSFVMGMLPLANESDSFTLSTGNESADDYVEVDYGIHSDTVTPDTISLYINSVDYSATLGGPWAVGGGATTIDLDITAQILLSTLQQEHTIEARCASGQGEIEFTIEIYNTIQAIAVV